MYTQEIWDHFRNPRNEGALPSPDASGESEYPACGDRMRLEVRLADGRVAEARFRATGCGVAIAAGSAGTEWITGRALDEARALSAFELDRLLGGVPPSKRHALLMFLDCLAQALGPRTERGD